MLRCGAGSSVGPAFIQPQPVHPRAQQAHEPCSSPRHEESGQGGASPALLYRGRSVHPQGGAGADRLGPSSLLACGATAHLRQGGRAAPRRRALRCSLRPGATAPPVGSWHRRPTPA
eukprot:scaffold3159_cov393-Prasinococcus_capsulatus_cf.AAC.14